MWRYLWRSPEYGYIVYSGKWLGSALVPHEWQGAIRATIKRGFPGDNELVRVSRPVIIDERPIGV